MGCFLSFYFLTYLFPKVCFLIRCQPHKECKCESGLNRVQTDNFKFWVISVLVFVSLFSYLPPSIRKPRMAILLFNQSQHLSQKVSYLLFTQAR